jgi:hypothetical protein
MQLQAAVGLECIYLTCMSCLQARRETTTVERAEAVDTLDILSLVMRNES